METPCTSCPKDMSIHLEIHTKNKLTTHEMSINKSICEFYVTIKNQIINT